MQWNFFVRSFSLVGLVAGMLMPSVTAAVQPPRQNLQPVEVGVTQTLSEQHVGISVWRDRFEEEQQTAFFASLGPVEGAQAMRQNAERLFGVYVPEHHDALLLEGDIMDPGLWDEGLGMTGAGEPFWFSVAEVFEAPLPPDLAISLGHADLRGGFVMLEMTSALEPGNPGATTHISALWVRYDDQTLIQPAVLFQNTAAAATLFASMGEELRGCPTCIYQNCMDAKAKADYESFKASWGGYKTESRTSNIGGGFLCLAGAIVTCSPPVVAVPVLGQTACAGTATCAAVSFGCAARNEVAFYSRDKAYAACLCAQSRQRGEGGPVGGCTAPNPPKCTDL